MDSLRICHVIHNTQCGGTESMLLKVIRELRHRHEFTVLSLMECGEIGESIRALGVPVHAIQVAEAGKPKPHRLYRAVTEIRKAHPQVVQTWAYHADLVGGLAARIATNAPVLWNIRHATLDPQLDSKNVRRSAKLCGRLSQWIPSKILLNSEAAVPVHAAAGYRQDIMQVIPNGFDTKLFRPMPEQGRAIRAELAIDLNSPVVGMCGRFHPHKGQAQFVRVAAELAKRNTQTQFIMVGHHCDAANRELHTWIQEAGLIGRVHLLGSRRDMPCVLSAMDVYLLPSLTEGMPNVIGEAMACGVPVVASNVGDAGKLLNGCGQLVPPNDIRATTLAVDRYLQMSDAERKAIGQQGRNHIEQHYALPAIATQYEQAWHHALKERNRATSLHLEHSTSTTKVSAPMAAKPKLVHVTTIPMTQWLFLRGQFAFMADRGYDVHSVSSPGGYQEKIRERDPVTTHAISISRKITPWQDARALYHLFRLFRKLRPEIVQLSTPKAALLGAIAAKAARVPVRIYQVRGLSSESESGLTRRIFQQLERLTARLCNAHLVNARSLLEYAQQANILHGGLVAGQGMSNGVDLARFDPAAVQAADMRQWDPTWGSNVGPVIGFVGRLTRDKGLEDIYQAWVNLREEFPTARLLLVGPWESENAVSKTCYDGLHADSRVILTGTQDHVVPFYKRMDVFVYPSHGTEGFPNAPMEAAAMQLPVIATRVVGCVDAVAEGETGQIISPRTPTALESHLRAYLSQPLLRKQHGVAGRERIRTGFAPQDLWQQFHEYYVYLLRRSQLNQPQPSQPAKGKRAA